MGNVSYLVSEIEKGYLNIKFQSKTLKEVPHAAKISDDSGKYLERSSKYKLRIFDNIFKLLSVTIHASLSCYSSKGGLRMLR